MPFSVNQQVFVRVGLGSTAEYYPAIVTHDYGDGTYDVEPFEEDADNPYFQGGTADESQLSSLC